MIQDQIKEREFVCKWCGKTFTSTAFNAKYCCIECKRKSAYDKRKKKLKLPKNSLRDIVLEAEEKGVSYGVYVARYMK